ncbi:hypothetical protein [Agrococcus sp. DT81.2]|uniref:hypothetical protein n=1 Tax=Agrococcus sp. DT81.2 TaxID=3393414 RepID=UPI003CE49A40
MWIDDDELVVSPGLAISPRGRVLLLRRVLRIPLDASHLPALPVDGYWKVEIHWAWDTSGSAPAYGDLCGDGCADGSSTIRPWRDEGVEVRIEPEALRGFDAVPDARLRANWLSSAYFERERVNGGPWLVPGTPGAPIPPLRSRDWVEPTPAPDERGVPLAILYGEKGSDDTGYRVQMWTARRLADGAAAHATWQSRLGMRRWSVFLAQILQFEAELIEATGVDSSDRGVLGDIGPLHDSHRMAKTLLDALQHFDAQVGPRDPLRNQARFRDLEQALIASERDPLVQPGGPPLAEEYGFGELPAAGYISMDEHGEDVRGAAEAFFGAAADLRVRRLRADQVADEVLAAQHRDRIPLRPIGEPLPQVDILVPVVPADKVSVKTPSYGWVAFVRRGPEPELPDVVDEEITHVDVSLFIDNEFTTDFSTSRLDDIEKATLKEPIGRQTYPFGRWEYPGSEVAATTRDRLIHFRPVAILAFADGDAPLAASRAGLFWMSLDSGSADLPIYAFGDRSRHAIVIVVEVVLL